VDSMSRYGDSASTVHHLPRHGRSTDVFSLGCVFVEMLVVLSTHTVTQFHESCIGYNRSFGRALGHVNTWFSQIAEPERGMYGTFVKPLINRVREKRPSSSDFLLQLNAAQPYMTLPCLCTKDLEGYGKLS